MARIVFIPGYETRVKVAVADNVFNVAQDIASDVRGNIRGDGLIQTGALLESVGARRHGTDASVKIGTDHWEQLEYGTAPHTMIAKPGQVFTFVKANGERVFTTKIRHPGNRAYRIVRRAVYKKRRLR